MRIARYRHRDAVRFGIVEGPTGQETVRAIDGTPFGTFRVTGAPVTLADVELLVPTAPSKIIGFGRNFAPAERQADEEPSFFFKPPTSLVAHGGTIRLPRQAAEGALYEVELAVVIGRECHEVRSEDFSAVVFGYTIANDITAVGLSRRPAGNYPVKAKAFDTFCPLGPWIETDIDPTRTRLGCEVDGVSRQEASTADLITGVADLVSIASGVMTLLPGDVILTGTPPGLAALTGGESISAWIDGIGRLDNPVSA